MFTLKITNQSLSYTHCSLYCVSFYLLLYSVFSNLSTLVIYCLQFEMVVYVCMCGVKVKVRAKLIIEMYFLK